MIVERTLLEWPFADVVQELSRRDAAIYALGVGLGADPLDEGQLRFVRQEDNEAFPTLPVVLCRGAPWPADPRSGVDYTRLVHGEQGLELIRPLPDMICDLPTFANQALLYRLNGDLNPLHSHPASARQSGFDVPILHGLCSYGVAAHAVLRSYCGYDSGRLKAIDVRFSAPVFPGETLSIELWRDGATISFRAFVRAREAKVLDNGRAVIDA